MNKKNIVSIEDRIPKLKQERKKKANRRLIFYLTIFFLLIMVIIYLQSPLSNVKNISVTGNKSLTKKEVVTISGIQKPKNIWMINQKHIEQKLNANPSIKSVSVERKLPQTIDIDIVEYRRVGYVNRNHWFYPVIGNGKILTTERTKGNNGHAPLLLNFETDDYLKQMSKELTKLPKSILHLISEIEWTPTNKNKHKITLFMNDGQMVDGSIRHFASDMKVYPSIAKQLKPNEQGIIHIGFGAYFEPFQKKSDKNEEK